MTDPTERPCIATGCQNPAKGHFCTPCWEKLPWDLKAAITSARKTGYRRKEHAQKAKDFLDQLQQQQGETNATGNNRN